MVIAGLLLVPGACVLASPLLAVRALLLQSWVMMWIAALIFLLVGSALLFSLGAVVFLLTNLQVAATSVWRRRLTRTESLAPLVLVTMVWALVVPGQEFGPVWFGGFRHLPLVEIVVLAVLLLPVHWGIREPALP